MIAFATAGVASTIGAHFDGLYNLPDGQTLAEAVKAGTQSLKFSIEIGRAMAHGLSGGVFGELGGGDFGGGFAAGAFGSLAGSAMTTAKGQGFFGLAGDGDFTGLTKRTVAAAIVGGTAAEIGGGKFANGAATAGIQHLFNAEKVYKKKDWNVEKVEVYFDGKTDEEFLKELGVPAAVVSGLVASGALPTGAVTSGSTAKAVANALSDGSVMIAGERVSAPGEVEAILGLVKSIEYQWELRQVRQQIEGYQIQVTASFKVQSSPKRNRWAQRRVTYRTEQKYKGTFNAYTKEKVVAEARRAHYEN